MKRQFNNEGDVSGSQQYGIGVTGDVEGDVDARISVTSNYSTSNSSYTSVDSHDVTSVNYASYTSVDSHDTTNVSYASYTSIDSHDTYVWNESHDTHNTYNIDAQFTSASQVATFGVFFGNGAALRVFVALTAIAGILIYTYLEEVLLGLAAITVVSVAATIATQVVKRQRRINAERATMLAQQEEQEARRQFIAEERAHQLQLAAISRPVYIVANSPKALSSAMTMLEDHNAQSEPIEIAARPQAQEVHNDRRIR